MRASLVVGVALMGLACGDSGGPANGPPASVIKAAGDAGQATVGQQLTPPPKVRVTDAEGRGVPGATVTFAVASGGGSVSAASAVTDASGEATVGWTLGTTAGANTLTATVSSIAPVTFTATGVAGPATTIAKESTDGLELHIGSAASPRPAVRLKDAHGNDVSGAAVTFAVTGGGGTATGTSQTTDASGVATVGSWTLGSAAGTNTMTATTGSLTAVTFTMSGVDKCAQSPPEYPVGSSVPGSLASGDCALPGGQYADRFTITRNAPTAFRLDQKSTAVDSRLVLFSLPDNRLVQSGPAGLDASMTFIVGPGSFIVGASSVNSGGTGAYTLESTMINESQENCATQVLVNSPITSQNITTTDCTDVESSGTYYGDRFVIFVQQGQTYCVSQTTSAFNPYFEIQSITTGFPTNSASASGSGTRTAKASFTPNGTEHRYVFASTLNLGQSGAYTLSFAPGTCP
jgi:hypothetical protein